MNGCTGQRVNGLTGLLANWRTRQPANPPTCTPAHFFIMPIKVFIVDDSLFIRSLVKDFLNSDPEIEIVGTAKSGREAIKKIPELRPDCITLDISMPGLDGLSTLKYIMNEFPTPVVVLSAYGREDADIAIECLNHGAVSFVPKPSDEISLDIETIKDKLIKEIKTASKVKVKKIKSLLIPLSSLSMEGLGLPAHRRRPEGIKIRGNKVFIIGASTGGPQTLEAVLPCIPSDFPATIIVAQHMPNRFFTESLTVHLNRACKLRVEIPEDNEAISPQKIYLAPGGFHLTITRINTNKNTDTHGYPRVSVENQCISVLTEVLPNSLSPSIDMIMESAAGFYGGNTVGIILSGIGDDGMKGMKAIKDAGGKTIAQDESALIFGMPKEVIDAGLADRVLPVEKIAEEIIAYS